MWLDVYYLIGFEPEAGKFFFYMLVVALLSSTTSALSFAVSARAPVTTVAILGTALCYVIQLVCICTMIMS